MNQQCCCRLRFKDGRKFVYLFDKEECNFANCNCDGKANLSFISANGANPQSQDDALLWTKSGEGGIENVATGRCLTFWPFSKRLIMADANSTYYR